MLRTLTTAGISLCAALAVCRSALAQTGDAAPEDTSSWGISGGVLLLALAAVLLFFAIRQFRVARVTAESGQNAEEASRAVSDSLNAVLLDRSDGAAIWDGDRLQIAVGCAGPVKALANPLDPKAIAFALVRADNASELAGLLSALIGNGIGFEEMFFDTEGQRRLYSGRTLGARALLDIGEVRAEPAHLSSPIDRLEASQRRIEALETAFTEAPVYAWRRDRQGRLDWVNGRFVSAVEAPGRDSVLDCQIELLTGGEAEELRALAARVRETGAPANLRKVAVIDGERRTLEFRETPVDGGTLGFAADVSAQVGASEALMRQIEANDETLSRLSRGIAIFGKEGRLSFHNEPAAQIWGIDAAIAEAHPSLPQLLNAMRDVNRVPQSHGFRAWRDEFVKACETLTEPIERTWHMPDGIVVHVVAQPHPLGGKLLVFEDITNYHTLKRDAATASAVHRAAFSRLTEGVIVIGLDGRCSLTNEAFARMWRLDKAELEGEHVTDIAQMCRPLFDNDEIYARIIAHISGATEEREVWHETLHRTDGTVLGMSTAPLPDGATMFAFRDITDSFSKERMLTDQNVKLKEIARLKSQFLKRIHTASHELKIPLNTIVGFSEIMAHEMYGELNPRQHEYIDGIYTASNELRQLIGGIIDLAMLEMDYYAFRIESIDVRQMLDSAIGFMERNSNHRVDFRLDCPAPVGEIPGDAPRFREIAHSLLDSLSASLPVGETVEVGVRRNQGMLTIWIGPERSEIPDSVREILLHDLGDDSMPEIRKVSLAITLVRQFVERQGGSIAIERGIGHTREAVVYHLLTDADAVRAAINRDRSTSPPDAAE